MGRKELNVGRLNLPEGGEPEERCIKNVKTDGFYLGYNL